MALPEPRPLGAADLVWFDITRGLPTAFGVLRSRLGLRRAGRIALGLMWEGFRRDPLDAVTEIGWHPGKERLVRRQLRSALLLHSVLSRRRDLTSEEALELTGTVIAETGAAFVQRAAPPIDPVEWRRAGRAEREAFLRAVTGRFFNSECAENVITEDDEAGFDVVACRFVQLLGDVGLPELAPWFCRADSLHFDRSGGPVVFRRTATLAEGARWCDFRFDLDDA